MASYSVTLYLNSGFNSINIPDNPARLESSATVISSVPALQILQDKFLSQVDIKATWDEVEDCDYIKVGSFYYSVQGVQMLNTNVARLSITPDFITSAGGFTISDGGVATDFDILDGITDRQTVSVDDFGLYTDEDPLMAPQRPLKISTEWLGSTDSNGVILLSTLLDLAQQAAHSKGTVYTDEETGETVTVPQTYQADPSTYAKVTIEGNDITTGQRWYNMSGTAVDTQLQGIARARALGIESAITDQWRCNYIGAIASTDTSITGDDGNTYTDQVVQVGTSTGTLTGTISAGYATPGNNRILYGEYNKYGLMTCAGNSLEAKPEEIMTSATVPSITYKADPRPDGKPYFRFTTMNGDTEFFRNCIAGSTWAKVPLTYQGSSGSALTRLNFDNSRKSQELAKNQYNDTYAFNQIKNAGQTMADMTAAAMSTNAMAPGAGFGAALSTGVSGLFTGLELGMQQEQYMQTYRQDKANELSQLYQNTTIYTPTVTFPYNSDYLRDAKNNGVLLYKYSYDDADITRIDTLLTMYGYKEAEAVTPANFYRRSNFDYVQCSSISITGLPRWWNDGIADQLRNGVRVWHTKPSSVAYSSNPIRS